MATSGAGDSLVSTRLGIDVTMTPNIPNSPENTGQPGDIPSASRPSPRRVQ